MERLVLRRRYSTAGSFALAKEAVTAAAPEDKTGRRVMSPIDGPEARGLERETRERRVRKTESKIDR